MLQLSDLHKLVLDIFKSLKLRHFWNAFTSSLTKHKHLHVEMLTCFCLHLPIYKSILPSILVGNSDQRANCGHYLCTSRCPLPPIVNSVEKYIQNRILSPFRLLFDYDRSKKIIGWQMTLISVLLTDMQYL